MKIRILIRLGFIRTGALIGIGARTNKNTFGGGGLNNKGALTGRREIKKSQRLTLTDL